MPRPVPTQSASLFDFVGSKAVQQLEQASEVTAERRRQKRGALAAAIGGAASAAGPSEALFASRIPRGLADLGPRRVQSQRHAVAAVKAATPQQPAPTPPSATGPSAARQARADEIRKRAWDLAAGLPQEEDGDGPEDAAGAREQLERAFGGYISLCAGDGGDADSTVALRALEDWVSRTRTCCICIEGLRREDRIWSCPQCAVPTHLGCIQSWASRLIAFVQSQNMRDAEPWYCPNCRRSFGRSEYPSQYRCFCGKEVEPRVDPWVLPHSCGDHCDKELACGHRCKLLCHPGRCPPCPLAVAVPCHCGAAKQTKRCGNPSFSCGRVCGRELACGKHHCGRECHAGDCGRCETKLVAACRCGRKKKLMACADVAEFRCENICGATKPCGVHKCEEVCHEPGQCPPCPAEKTCACGRTTLAVSCRYAASTRVRCEHTCGKLLDCRKHRCERRCHDGPCRGCPQVSRRSCRCGAVTKDAPCSQELLCDRKCNKDRNCGRHKCHRRCCDARCPPCAAACDRKLDCGVCRCTLVCGHGGFDSLGAELYNCPPCSKQTGVGCFCGVTTIMVPCGLPKKPPPCQELCRVPPTCHHAKRLPHRCHTGPCPPCKQECGVDLACGHRCRRPCHDPVVEFDLAGASWARRPREQTLEEALISLLPPPPRTAEVQCPPCDEHVDRPCLGLHVRERRKCRERKWFSCSGPCGNVLPCGNHRCQRPCHALLDRRSASDFEADFERYLGALETEESVNKDSTTMDVGTGAEVNEALTAAPNTDDLTAQEADPEDDEAGTAEAAAEAEAVPGGDAPKGRRKRRAAEAPPPSECGECELQCRRPRPERCRHKCPWPCHFEPCPPCFEDVTVWCYCEQSLLTYACCEVISWPDVENEGLENPFRRCPMICHRTHSGCPHMCPARCHFGPCPPCARQNVSVRCRCGRLKEQRPCAEVWVNGKQVVLDCIEDCKKAEALAAAVPEELEGAGAGPPPEAPAATPAELRERKKEKRKKRDEELEERRLQQEAAKRQLVRARRIRVAAICLGSLLFVVCAVYAVVLVRRWNLERQQEEMRELVRERHGRGRGT